MVFRLPHEKKTPQMQVRGRGIEPRLDPQGPALTQFRRQFLLVDELRTAPADLRHLPRQFLISHRRHGISRKLLVNPAPHTRRRGHLRRLDGYPSKLQEIGRAHV